MTELYRRARPRSLKHVVGQQDAVKALTKMAEEGRIPHVILLHGPSGTGKTTLGRIVKRLVGCDERLERGDPPMDFQEVNCAEARGIDEIRQIQSRMNLAPVAGRCRLWLLDETHRLTPDSMSALLKTLEDTPDHVHFILCTTDPDKLLPTIRNRCTTFALKALTPKEIEAVIGNVVNHVDGYDVPKSVVDRIVEVAEGSARKALVLLEQVKGLPEQEAVDAILKEDTKRQAYELVKLLVFEPGAKWEKVTAILKGLEDDPEKVRRQVLGLASKVALDGGKAIQQAYEVLRIFRYDFFATGKPGLVAACMEAFNATRGK